MLQYIDHLLSSVCKNIFCFNFDFIKVLLFLLPYLLWIVQAKTNLIFKASFLKLKRGNWGKVIISCFVQSTQIHLPLGFQNEFNFKTKDDVIYRQPQKYMAPKLIKITICIILAALGCGPGRPLISSPRAILARSLLCKSKACFFSSASRPRVEFLRLCSFLKVLIFNCVCL